MSTSPFYANVDHSPRVGDTVRYVDQTHGTGVVESLDCYVGAANVGVAWANGERSYDYPATLTYVGTEPARQHGPFYHPHAFNMAAAGMGTCKPSVSRWDYYELDRLQRRAWEWLYPGRPVMNAWSRGF